MCVSSCGPHPLENSEVRPPVDKQLPMPALNPLIALKNVGFPYTIRGFKVGPIFSLSIRPLDFPTGVVLELRDILIAIKTNKTNKQT